MAEAKGGNTPGVSPPAAAWSDAPYSCPTTTESAKAMMEKRAAETRSATDKK